MTLCFSFFHSRDDEDIDDEDDEHWDGDEDEEDYGDDYDEDDYEDVAVTGVDETNGRTRIGVEQAIPNNDAKLAADTERVLEEARAYREQAYDKFPTDLVNICTLNHESCAMWAAMGECDANPNCKCLSE